MKVAFYVPNSNAALQIESAKALRRGRIGSLTKVHECQDRLWPREDSNREQDSDDLGACERTTIPTKNIFLLLTVSWRAVSIRVPYHTRKELTDPEPAHVEPGFHSATSTARRELLAHMCTEKIMRPYETGD